MKKNAFGGILDRINRIKKRIDRINIKGLQSIPEYKT
jgi:hypothetical protein